METETTTALTAFGHSPAPGRIQEGRGEKGLTGRDWLRLHNSVWRTDRLEMLGFLGDNGSGTARRTAGDGVNHRALNFRTEIVWLLR